MMDGQTFAKLYTKAFQQNWNILAFSDYGGKNFKYSDVAEIINSLRNFYQQTGLKRGDKIAVLGRNSAHWAAAFLSVIAGGLVIVPILPDFSESDTNHIINHSETKLIFSTKTQLEKIDKDKLPLLQTIIVLDDFSLFASDNKNSEKLLKESFRLFNNKKLEKQDFIFEEWESEEMCMISYTSGTSGFTKGVMIPERSLVSNIIYAQEHMPLMPDHKIVSFLPMAHVYGLLFEFLFPASLGCHITFLSRMPSPAVITKAFGEIKPHLILSVPLVIEKIYKKKILPAIQKPLVSLLLKIPVVSSIILKKIRSKMIETFGGRFFEIVIGGAPLSADVEIFFKKINFPATIGYGMTECAPLISYEAWNKTMPSSAGRLVDRIEVRIDSEDPYNVVGEIQIKGQNVMLGYYKNEKATEAAFTDDGWLKTGDLGIIDKNNFIFIRGRSKNMLLGPSGQNIYPEELEAKICNQNYVAECVVVERDHKLVGLVYPDFEAMEADNIQEDILPNIMDENRKAVNTELPRYEQIVRIEIVDQEFEKTPKRNIKRYKYV